jgi:quercetin dioxygenase-like cupin family protein
MTKSLAIFLINALAVLGAATPVAGGEAQLPHAFDAGWKGEKTCEVIFEDAQVRVGRCAFPPGVGHEKHYHNPHFGYVLEGGTLRISDQRGTRTVTTSTAGTWSTDVQTVHEAVNIGETTTSYVIVEPKAK